MCTLKTFKRLALFFSIVFLSCTYAKSPANSNNTATISATFTSQQSASSLGQFIACSSRLATCSISLSISDGNFGTITIKNTSTQGATAYDIHAYPPAGWDNVVEDSFCAELLPGDTCVVVIHATEGLTHSKETAFIRGSNTEPASFDLTVTD
ncbi:hypothetical protein [Legionella waltersii]|uniref:Uncharacterized protein n=1 Tax=Legionella waltersii TaxID=66969 RepID=A0A0W1A519_9GAMM|nr:hypothetical protein [Legionella waltersii]KTD76437.1 hypothetical protein Lwal_2159 [Legionella waltersii]SNV14445.1 Uncharacterised protein [Legionella waltersii]